VYSAVTFFGICYCILQLEEHFIL